MFRHARAGQRRSTSLAVAAIGGVALLALSATLRAPATDAVDAAFGTDERPRTAVDTPAPSAGGAAPPGRDIPALDNAALDNAALDNAALDNAGLDNAGLDNAGLDTPAPGTAAHDARDRRTSAVHPPRFAFAAPTTATPAREALASPPPAEVAPPPQPPPQRVAEVEVAAGDTLLGVLTRLGVGRAEAHAAVDGLSDVYDPRRLRPGQRLEVETDAAARSLVRLEFDLSRRERVRLVRAADGGFRAALTAKPVLSERTFVSAEIESSLHAAGRRRGVPSDVVADLVELFSWDVDFQRDTRPGDGFALLFEIERLADGDLLGGGAIHYARLDVGGRTLEAFRFQHGGEVDYFDRDGRSVRKFLLRTPVSGARMTSGFGMRRHPILGYNRMHKGVDFAAPHGTPIYAAGAGRLVRVGRRGGYGNYVRIDHGNGYATAYAHLTRFAAGMRSGRRVQQGEVIGFVGSTGRSTGPHLHYEVLKDGRQVNPLAITQPPASRLADAVLENFRAHVAAVDADVASLAQARPTLVAGDESRPRGG